jgi:hypothetical protein
MPSESPVSERNFKPETFWTWRMATLSAATFGPSNHNRTKVRVTTIYIPPASWRLSLILVEAQKIPGNPLTPIHLLPWRNKRETATELVWDPICEVSGNWGRRYDIRRGYTRYIWCIIHSKIAKSQFMERTTKLRLL